MNKFFCLLLVLPLAIMAAICGCRRSNEPTVIQPIEPYQLTEREEINRRRAHRALSEQRQQ